MPINNDDINAAGGLAEYAREMLDRMSPFGDETPVQAEVTSINSQRHGFMALGTVTQTLDEQRAGRIKVDSPAFPEGPQTCDYVSPIAGAGYGFFAVPGIGATVLVARVASDDPASQNLWFGCLYAAGQRELPDTKSQPYITGDASQLPKNEVMDNGEDLPNDPTVSYGVPNENDVYRDNDLPDSFVLKHPKGHSISLTDKNTSERKIDEIKLKTSGNKRLVMSDAPAPAGGENITLIDENSNQIRITSVGHDDVPDDSIITQAGGDIMSTTKKGAVDHIISSESDKDFSIDNLGKGNVDITSHNGTMTLEADKQITLKCGSSTITLSKDKISLNSPTMTINASNGTLAFGTGSISVGGDVQSNSVTTGTVNAGAVTAAGAMTTSTISIGGTSLPSNHIHLDSEGGNTGPAKPTP